MSGRAKAIIPTEQNHQFELFRLLPGDFFGEEILISNEPRENTVVAIEDTMTLSIPGEVLEKLIIKSEEIKSLIDQNYIERKLRTDLRRVPIFTPLNDNLFSEILGAVELKSLPKGTVVFREGDEGDAFYLIRKGKISVQRIINGQKKAVAILSDGQFFGEISLLLEEKRNATVEVLATTEMVKISREKFVDIVEKDQSLTKAFQGLINERKKKRNDILINPHMAVIGRKLLDLNDVLYRHLDIISQCSVERINGTALLATLPESRYPYVYPRDSACASRFLYKLAVSSFKSGDFAFRLLTDIAKFLQNCQRKDGYWGQRYNIEGKDNSIYKQEDNVAHGIIVLCRYLLAAKRKRKNIPDTEKIIEAIVKGSQYARKSYYRNEIHLFYSTTSIHESAIEEGYSIWVNFAYLLALKLIEQIGIEYDVTDKFSEEIILVNFFESHIYNVFNINERFVRRLKPDGDIDLRPDITLMSPFYFNTGMDVEHFNNTENFANSIKYIEQTLWDPIVGLLQRYLPFVEDPDTHTHAGNGPWLPYSSILAQYYFHIGEIGRGDEILSLIDKYSTREGHQCEHVTTPARFYEFKQLQWINGKDSNKELFTYKILLPEIPYDFIVEELNNMKRAYNTIEKKCKEQKDKEYITFVSPLMWSHAEYAMALMLRAEKELEKLQCNI
jgi:CRP-like cAMP-binding protein